VKHGKRHKPFAQQLEDVRKNPPKIERIHTPASLSFKHFVSGSEFCLSESIKQEIRDVMDCFRQSTTMTWQQVLQSGGKGANKAGLGCTQYADTILKCVKRPQSISPEINIYGIRASQKYRVFVAYIDHVLYVLWFDRNHKIVPAD
jgi:hypothetical protein